MSRKRIPLTSPVPKSHPNLQWPSELTRAALRAIWAREGDLIRALRERHLVEHERAVAADVLEVIAMRTPSGAQVDARKLLIDLAYAIREGKEPWDDWDD